MRSRFKASLIGFTVAGACALAAAPASARAPTTTPTKAALLCRVFDGVGKMPCAGRILGEKLLAPLLPLEVKNMRRSVGPFEIAFSGKLSKLSLKTSQDGIALSMELSSTIEVLSGAFKGKTIKPAGKVKGRLVLGAAPTGPDCAGRKAPYTMVTARFELTDADVKGLAGVFEGKAFVAALNLLLEKGLYEKVPAQKKPAYAICLEGQCPAGTAPSSWRWGGARVENPYFRVDLDKNAGVERVRIKSHTFFCKLVDGVMRAKCTDNFIGGLASSALPLTAELPASAGDSGVSFTMESLRVSKFGQSGYSFEAAASLAKKGSSDVFHAKLAAAAELVSKCDASGFLLRVRPTLRGLAANAPPSWLTNGLVRGALNAFIAKIDVCGAPLRWKTANKTFNVCGLADVMLSKCSAALADGILDAVSPLRIAPEEAVSDPALKKLLAGIRVTIERGDVGKTSDGRARVALKLRVSKNGESTALTASGSARIGVMTKCARDGSYALRVMPTLDDLKVGAPPQWLLGVTVVQLANHFARAWWPVCVAGKCPSTAGAPSSSSSPSEKSRATCNFDRFGGK